MLHAGYQALLAGIVDEDFDGTVNALERDAEIGGDMDVEVDGEDYRPPPALFAPAPRVQIPLLESDLTVRYSARIKGNLTYASDAEAQTSPAAQIEGEVVRE